MTPDPYAHLKSENGKYLSSLDFTGPLRDRVQRVIKFYSEIAEIKPSFLFVSEYWQGEQRVFDSVWLFNEDTACEAKKFIGEDNFDCVPLRNRIYGWQAKSKNFDWYSNSVKNSSRFTVDVRFDENVGGTFQASGDNCLRLIELLKTYNVPNLNKQASVPAQPPEA